MKNCKVPVSRREGLDAPQLIGSSPERLLGGIKEHTSIMSIIRIQAEVMLWLIVVETTVRQISAAALPGLLVAVDQGQSKAKNPWKAGEVLLESSATIVIMLWVLNRRFSPGSNTRALCRRRINAGGQLQLLRSQSASRYATRVALSLGSFAVAGVAVGGMIDFASVDNFSSWSTYGSPSMGAVQAAVTSMVRDPILEELFYRGVVFDRLLGKRKGATTTHGAILRAAMASSCFFGGMHLLMHLLRDGLRVPWLVYFQAIFAVGAGYVYCLLLILAGGRLLPTVLLHAVNNISSSFYHYPPHSQNSHSSSGNDRDSSNNSESNSSNRSDHNSIKQCSSAQPSCRVAVNRKEIISATSGIDAGIPTIATERECQETTPPLRAAKTTEFRITTAVGTGAVQTSNITPELRRVCTSTSRRFTVHTDATARLSFMTACGLFATTVAYCMAGRACSIRLHQLNKGAGATGSENGGCSDNGTTEISPYMMH